MTRVYLALGSNLTQPLQQIHAALSALDNLPQTRLARCSSFYRSRPLGPQDQPDYLNAVAELATDLSAEQLLDHTQAIEREQGRVRKAQRWGPRTLDVDILLFGDEVIATPRLTVPHYDMKNREFMLYPLAEIAPELIFPDGESLSYRLLSVNRNGLILWDETPDSR
ncbi:MULTISPECIES: 2-amino-4-hydroxy-6-hydroxymethyldihydropteridine diphosphokinase [Brenneria]|uniref:2-amino-4-hydroxy-6-hydroxymethyldihydropteridine pyrophosphokinase n=1 Tax=Brenneria nigrifluens DSM 30175 = ATCC 13028 TaxID=1121120 RepID=A0A2U1UHF3_9GAMM|nr:MULTISPECIES: 2-amino-4-hydroxy-6-hydroxymethyldihydropteridine diphosphokinase [Brenneria]EHD20492.1 2-amino-4-hydroxy-6-hydroxymethyldihydropteridine pyrophosphokinase [Brenneria sp. EniD312]PWC21099.1 2-amino-4-hydroxy-6-hydroxymethyldihydropteridine diphosphokinase [Brenneria nigrifluens DSM 30175 = ATCC 13028]QCR03689.1 2-amino-4-hydroxy-6-hydroxymethyldihydropteridine diphosphokinase [Brenneria nigrifluens DSM 30175 = ATCC 13028]